jgi:uncharacterized membrane protein YtjA (UPF0391 family)
LGDGFPVGLDLEAGDVPPSLRAALVRVEGAQRGKSAAFEGEGSLRRLVLDDGTIYLPEVGHRDTPSSAGMAVFIVVALIAGFWGIGGLAEGTWAKWLLPVSGVCLVLALVLGKRWGRETANTKRDGVERDGTYLTSLGVLTRSHGRFRAWPLECIEDFEKRYVEGGPSTVVVVFTAGGVRQKAWVGGEAHLDLLREWLASARKK